MDAIFRLIIYTVKKNFRINSSKYLFSDLKFFSSEEQDAVYEMASIILNNAIWLTKHSAYVAAILAE